MMAGANEVRLQFLSLEDTEVEGLYMMQEQEMSLLRIPAVFLPPPVTIPLGEALVLYRVNEAAEEGAPPWREVARVAVPERVSEAVVLVQTQGERISAAVVPMENNRFPAGSYMLFNRTPQVVLIGLDQEVTRIPSQNVRVVRPSIQERKPMPVYFRFESDEENRSLVSTRWFHNPANREFVFLSTRGDGLEIRVRSVSRRPQAEE